MARVTNEADELMKVDTYWNGNSVDAGLPPDVPREAFPAILEQVVKKTDHLSSSGHPPRHLTSMVRQAIQETIREMVVSGDLRKVDGVWVFKGGTKSNEGRVRRKVLKGEKDDD
jgi:hypothetical protein